MRFTKVTPQMFFGNDTDCMYARRSQVLPVTVSPPVLVEDLTASVLVNVLCGSTLVKARFTTVADVYQRAWERLACLQGPSWMRNKFRVEVYFQERFLVDRSVCLREYGIRDGSQINVRVSGRLLGGSEAHLQAKEHEEFVHEFDILWDTIVSKSDVDFVARKMKCTRLAKNARKNKRFSVQSGEDTDEGISQILRQVRNFLPGSSADLLEDLLLFVAQLVRAKGRTDIVLASLTFIKLRTKTPLLSQCHDLVQEFMEELFPSGLVVQSDDSWLTGVSDFRSLLSQWESVKDSSLAQKFSKLCHFLVGYGCFASVGLNPAEHGPRLKDIGKNPLKHANFLYSIIDAMSLLLQRGLQFCKTGVWDDFLHGPKVYGDWYDTCLRLKREALGMGNLEAHGTNFHKFVAEVKDAIECGVSIVKFHANKDGAEFRAARAMLNDLQMVNANIVTKKAAQQERKAPFSLLVHGGSSVAKSTFTKMLTYYYAKLYNLPVGDEFKYTRNSADKFWSGFGSQAWCVLLDDIAFRAATSTVEDISLAEMISVINNVPFNPPQADLADKGKTPLRAEFVIATTNAKSLNADAHFHCPLAIQRRMPWVVTLVPKPDFCRDDAPEMICPSKMMLARSETDWPNYWQIKVEKVVPGGDLDGKGRQTAKHETIREFLEINEFLDWFKEVTFLFKTQQQSAMADDVVMSEFVLCHQCNRVKCSCGRVQSGLACVRPAHVAAGESWTEHDVHEDGHAVRVYTCFNGQYYVRTTEVFRGVLKPVVVSPVEVTGSLPSKMQVESVEYAEVLNIVLERQTAQETSTLGKMTGKTIQLLIGAYLRWGWVRSIVDKAMGNSFVRKWVLWAVKSYAPLAVFNRRVFEAIGGFAERVYLFPHWKRVIQGLTALGAVVLGYKVAQKAISYFKTPEQAVMVEQGARMSVTESFFCQDEKEAVWKNNRDHTTALDLPLASLNPNMTPEMVEKRILKNMARIRVKRSAVLVRPGNMFCIGGHLWVTDNHLFEGEGPYVVDILFEAEAPGVSSNRTITIFEGSLYRQPKADRIWVWLPDVNVRSVLHTLCMKESLSGTVRGRYVGLDAFVRPKSVEVHGLTRQTMHVETIPHPCDYWVGKSTEPTHNGDCGKVLISTDPHCSILGLHQVGSETCDVGAVILTQEACAEAMAHFKKPLIEPGFPKLSAEGVPKVLGPLHEKSPLRWLKQGSIIHYGSIEGYRRVPRSKVNYTLLGEKIIQERNWDVKFGRPDLKSWAPWHHALKDITSQVCNTDAGLLDHCVDAFVSDLLKGLPAKSRRDLQKVEIINAINGIPGVAHLDKMNFATSMGEPWCTTKKKYLIDAPTESIPMAKIFTPDVMKRVADIEADYANGVCACPIYSGQKKDEARAIQKLVDGKIRIFTGGPVDHSVVVRSHLHTFTKVMTENKVLFETGIGCAAQSLEWESFHDYLTQFGDDRMIAGDFEKYDKKMGAMWILAAFCVIIKVLQACGWTDEEVLPIYCIAEDIGHPLVNLGGDLIRTYGMNPSGHVLTVIINSLANSLYNRYAYASRHPEGKAWSFKTHVALLTYGDDNVMGVSNECTWFNHTTIAEEMAKIGVGYTMADKSTHSIPFIRMEEISFLKRTWRWDEDVGALLCPLEMASIHKMQVMCVEGKTLSKAQHQVEVLHAALGEYFFYGKEIFEAERAWMLGVGVGEIDIELELKPLPTYSQLKERFWKNSDGVAVKRLGLYLHSM